MPDAANSALLSLTSHELRGPAAVIRGSLKMIDADPALGDRSRRATGQARRAVARLVEMLDEVSELARLRDAKGKLPLRRLSVRSVLTQAVQAVTLPAGADCALDVVAPVDVRLRGDEQRLKSVFETLIVALARTQATATTIDLHVTARRASTLITVTPRTLHRGATSDRPLDVSRGGTGFLLPIAEAIVQRHGGRLRERWMAGRWVGYAVRL